MAIFHLSIRPISRAKGHSAVAQIAYDTRSKLTNERTGEKHDWSKHKADVIDWQIIGPPMQPDELAARVEQAEKRWDARVGRAMDVAVPHELNTKAQWELMRGFGLQLRDTYGVALCVSLHHPNTKGDQRNVHGHIFMTTRAVDAEGNFSKAKIRNLDDRKLGPLEIERIREMWETRCNRALRKAGVSEGVNRRSLQAQGIDRPATKHLGAKASAMTRNGCRLRKDEINQLISSDSRRLAEINFQLNKLKNHDRKSRKQSAQPQIRSGEKPDLAGTRQLHQSKPKRQTHRVAVSGKPGVAHHGNRHARNRSWTRPARPNTAGELVGLLARGASIGRIAQGHHFRGGQLLIGLLRTLRIVIRALEIEQQRQQQRAGIRMRL
ncbi:MAG: MobA/MobL family protein [Chthoniobacterales bacterium]|nr:MobA/MobL family protein [Chthoniobacterales bacterium]